jgi:hypothetical protein
MSFLASTLRICCLTNYIFLNSAPPKKKQRGSRGGKGKAKVQQVSVEDMENEADEEDIVQDLRLSDLE